MTNKLTGVIDDATAQQLRSRNASRAAQLIAMLGTHYACHLANAPKACRKVPRAHLKFPALFSTDHFDTTKGTA
jgi:hypothetical protein